MRRWIGTIANFFFPGLGYALFGPKRAQGVAWLLAMLGLTYVELSVKTAAPALYWPMFASVFLFNTTFAIDSWFELGAREAERYGVSFRGQRVTGLQPDADASYRLACGSDRSIARAQRGMTSNRFAAPAI